MSKDDPDYLRIKAKLKTAKDLMADLLRLTYQQNATGNKKPMAMGRVLESMLQMVAKTDDWAEAADVMGWDPNKPEPKEPCTTTKVLMGMLATGEELHSKDFPHMTASQEEALFRLGFPVTREMSKARDGTWQRTYRAQDSKFCRKVAARYGCFPGSKDDE